MPPLTDGCARVHQIWEIDPDLEGPEFPGACLSSSPPATLLASQLLHATGASLREIFKQWEPFMQDDAEEPGAGQQGSKGEPRILSPSPRRVLLPRCHPDAGRFEKIQTGGEQEACAAEGKRRPLVHFNCHLAGLRLSARRKLSHVFFSAFWAQ